MRQSERGSRAGEAGFTIIEGLVAALILAIILIGILPMITRSMQNNLQGNDATYEANAVTDRLETLYSLPFNYPDLTVAAGTTSLTTVDYYSLDDRTWTATAASGGNEDLYTRTVLLEYFGANDLSDDSVLTTPLDGDEGAGSIQLKRLTIDIAKQRVLGGSPYRVVALKAF